MRYRQWKKNYKKRYGVNPPASIDKRKRRRQAARAVNVLANADLGAALNRAAESIVNGLANAMRVFGSACDGAGTAFRVVILLTTPVWILPYKLLRERSNRK